MTKKSKPPVFPSLHTPITRFVYEHTQGRYKGMCRIIGLTPDMRKLVTADGPPTFIPNQNLHDHMNGVCLIRVNRGTAYYRELMDQGIKGKLGEFNPAQV